MEIFEGHLMKDYVHMYIGIMSIIPDEAIDDSLSHLRYTDHITLPSL